MNKELQLMSSRERELIPIQSKEITADESEELVDLTEELIEKLAGIWGIN